MGKFQDEVQLDINKHNAQYRPIRVEKCKNVHDRFLLIDDTVYHIGASIKDLGKKLFAFSKMEISAKDILKQINKPAYDTPASLLMSDSWREGGVISKTIIHTCACEDYINYHPHHPAES